MLVNSTLSVSSLRACVLVWALMSAMLVTSPCEAQTARLVAVNDMRDGIHVYVKSEHRDAWQREFIGRGRRGYLALNGPDRFEIAFRDLQGGWFRGDPLPLLQLIRENPNYRLTFGGIFATQMATHQYWDPYWQAWIVEDVAVQIRTAVTLNLQCPDGRKMQFVIPRIAE